MLTMLFLSFLQFSYSYETGYSIQCALQLVRKHKHFLKGWLSVCNLLLASVGPQLNRRAKRHGVSQTARRLNSVNSFLLLGFSFITHASGTTVYILPGFSNMNTLEVLP